MMSETTIRMENDVFIPVSVLTVYKCSGDDFYIEASTVRDVGKDGKLNLMASKPLTQNTLKKLVNASLGKQESEDGKMIIPEHILSYNDDMSNRYAVWYRKAGIKNVMIKGKKDIKLFMPALLYYAINDRPFVYALKTNKRPNLFTDLYYAPLFNITSRSNFCLGTAHAEDGENKSLVEYVKSMEALIWNSVFTFEGMVTVKSKRQGSADKYKEMYELYKRLSKSGCKFPKSLLLPAGISVHNVMKGL